MSKLFQNAYIRHGSRKRSWIINESTTFRGNLLKSSDLINSAYLLTKLSRGANNDCDGSLSRFQFLLIHDVDQHGPDKRCRFTAAGFGNPNHVPSGQSNRHTLEPDQSQESACSYSRRHFQLHVLCKVAQYLTLNRCGLSVLRLPNLVHQLLIKTKVGKAGT